MKPATTPPCPSLTIVATLPGRVDSAMLGKFRRADEPLVVVKLVGVGNSAPYDFHDKGTRSYIFRFESQMEGHVLRVPLHLWQAGKGRLAHELMEQRRMPHAMVVLLEPTPPPLTPQPNLAEKGATDTSTDTRNVVGPGAEPTVAPACGALTEPRSTGAAHGAAVAVKAVTQGSGKTLLHEAAYDLVEAPKRIKALAVLLGVTEEVLRAGIGHAQSRVELAHAGWVKRKATKRELNAAAAA